MRSYEAARKLFSFLGFIAWSVIVIGVLVALVGAGTGGRYGVPGAGLVAMVPGIGIAIAGFIQLAFVQMGRAQVDTAEYTQQMLKISRDQLEVSRQSLNQGNTPAKSFGSVRRPENASSRRSSFAAKPNPEKESRVEPSLESENFEYKGRTITREGNRFVFAKMAFNSVELAQQYIDRLGMNQNAKPLPAPWKP